MCGGFIGDFVSNTLGSVGDFVDNTVSSVSDVVEDIGPALPLAVAAYFGAPYLASAFGGAGAAGAGLGAAEAAALGSGASAAGSGLGALSGTLGMEAAFPAAFTGLEAAPTIASGLSSAGLASSVPSALVATQTAPSWLSTLGTAKDVYQGLNLANQLLNPPEPPQRPQQQQSPLQQSSQYGDWQGGSRPPRLSTYGRELTGLGRA